MIIIDGADCTGKTTLARSICEALGAQYLHCSFDKRWNMEEYHRLMLHTAGKLEQIANVPVVMDRWALSEHAYGNAYRDGPAYDTLTLMQEAVDAYSPTFIYCRTDHAAATHAYMRDNRKEMFDEISSVIAEYDKIIELGQYPTHILYDYTKHDRDAFVDAFCMSH